MAATDGAVRNIEALIRKGQLGQAREILEPLGDEPPRRQVALLSQLAWRSGLPEWGIKQLRLFVRDQKDATDAERMEYAVCLMRTGIFHEALELLDTVSSSTNPRAFLYKGFAWMSRWEYERALPFLRAYLKTLNPRSYDAVTANVNVAACLVFLREDVQAEYLLSKLIHENAIRGNRLLLNNSLQLGAALFIQKRDFKKGNELLKTAEEMLDGASPLERLLLDKWHIISKFLASDSSPTKDLEILRDRAEELRHWETIRDCDFYIALKKRDTFMMRKLFYGTPHASFRNRLLREWGSDLDVSSEFIWTESGKPAEALDWLVAQSPLDSSKLLQKTLRELSRDFYRPAFPTELYAKVFPDEYFNPISSPHRVQEAIRRLKREFETSEIPASVEFVGGAYKLTTEKNLAIRIPPPHEEKPQEESPGMIQLRRQVQAEAFTADGAAKTLGLSKRSAQRLLTEWSKQGLVEVIGRGKATRYRCSRVG